MNKKLTKLRSAKKETSILIPALSLIVAFASIVSNITLTIIVNSNNKVIEYNKLTFNYKVDKFSKYSTSLDQIYDAMDEKTLIEKIVTLEQSINELSFFLGNEQIKTFRNDLYNFRRNTGDYLKKYYQSPYTDFYSSAGRKTALEPFSKFRDEIRNMLMPDYNSK